MKNKRSKTMIGQMTIIVTVLIVAAFFVAGELILHKNGSGWMNGKCSSGANNAKQVK